MRQRRLVAGPSLPGASIPVPRIGCGLHDTVNESLVEAELPLTLQLIVL